VLVATDAAARGIDITNIEHVVQADFAASAVDFLHRVGAGWRCIAFVPCR
jgi:superfamily II DNA/RNA helicase